ncbi:hypothetical protein D3C75_989940 [compost metagenome]
MAVVTAGSTSKADRAISSSLKMTSVGALAPSWLPLPPGSLRSGMGCMGSSSAMPTVISWSNSLLSSPITMEVDSDRLFSCSSSSRRARARSQSVTSASTSSTGSKMIMARFSGEASSSITQFCLGSGATTGGTGLALSSATSFCSAV